MFGRAAIRLGIGPHSSFKNVFFRAAAFESPKIRKGCFLDSMPTAVKNFISKCVSYISNNRAKTHQQIQAKKIELECGPMPNLMVALPNTGGALCSTPQSLADAYY